MIDNTLLIKNLQNLEHMFIIFSQYTKMPYVECDPETYDDQIHVFSDKEEIQEFAKQYTEDKILLMAQEVPKAQAPTAFASMYGLGINAVVFHHNGTVAHLQLEEIINKPDMDKILSEKLPLMNPTLMLSALYFLEELHRPIEHDKKLVKELEEEMIANLIRSNYIIAMMPANPEEKLDPKNKNQPKVVNYIKDKEGQFFLPVFSDVSEFQKFYREKSKEIAMLVMPFKNLQRTLMEESKGLVLNPAGFGLKIVKEQLGRIMADFCS